MKISIIVPVYKVENVLPRCVESLINQTYKNIEIILVDDGSPDNCPIICDEYAKKDKRIQVIHRENGGLSEARNSGLASVSGQYILFVDSDDYIELDTCEKFIDALKDDMPDIVVGDYIEERENKAIPHVHKEIETEKLYSAESYLQKAIDNEEMRIEAWLNLYKTSFWKGNGFLFRKNILHEDMQLMPQVFLSAKQIQYVNHPFYHYIIREGSIMNQNNREKRYQNVMEIYSEWKVLIDRIKNETLKATFSCFLAKCFMCSCAQLKVKKPDYSIISKKYLLKYSKNKKELLKAILFIVSPRIYYIVYQMIIERGQQ